MPLFVGALKPRFTAFAAMAILGALLTTACLSAGDTSTPVPDDGGALFDGRTAADFYGSNCSSCHGRDRGGGIGPSLEPDKLSKDDAVYFETIARGRSGSSMPAWRLKGLTDREIDALVALLRTEP